MPKYCEYSKYEQYRVPEHFQVQTVFQSIEPQNTPSTAVFHSIEPRNTAGMVVFAVQNLEILRALATSRSTQNPNTASTWKYLKYFYSQVLVASVNHSYDFYGMYTRRYAPRADSASAQYARSQQGKNKPKQCGWSGQRSILRCKNRWLASVKSSMLQENKPHAACMHHTNMCQVPLLGTTSTPWVRKRKRGVVYTLVRIEFFIFIFFKSSGDWI